MLWLTSLHVVAWTAWMVALWYLPRLLVYHAQAGATGEPSATLATMERRLLKVIATPAMVIALVSGIALATWSGAWTQGWLHVKLLLVLGMTGVHGLLAREVRLFGAGRGQRSPRFFRILNEVPTLLFIGIVVMAIVQPF